MCLFRRGGSFYAEEGSHDWRSDFFGRGERRGKKPLKYGGYSNWGKRRNSLSGQSIKKRSTIFPQKRNGKTKMEQLDSSGERNGERRTNRKRGKPSLVSYLWLSGYIKEGCTFRYSSIKKNRGLPSISERGGKEVRLTPLEKKGRCGVWSFTGFM